MTLVENLSTLASQCDWRNSFPCIEYRADCGCREALFLFALREILRSRRITQVQIVYLQACLGLCGPFRRPAWVDPERE